MPHFSKGVKGQAYGPGHRRFYFLPSRAILVPWVQELDL